MEHQERHIKEIIQMVQEHLIKEIIPTDHAHHTKGTILLVELERQEHLTKETIPTDHVHHIKEIILQVVELVRHSIEMQLEVINLEVALLISQVKRKKLLIKKYKIN